MSTATGPDRDVADMDRLAAGHDAALSDLMERHGQLVFHYLIRLLHDEADAADLAQETFVRVYQNRSKFDPQQKFSTWLFTIASNLARDRLRWRHRHPQVSLDAENPETGGSLQDVLAESGPSPGESLDAAERADTVREAVLALTEDLRVPLVLAEYEGRSQSEIALILHCSVKAVEMRIYRARQQLRRRLEKLIRVA
jgi:RNA polymerase sigma-70 factor (ECF subfamily)